jgi:hypothetical protein
MKYSILWSAATFASISRTKNYTIILALQCLYHFLYLQKNDMYKKFFKLGYIRVCHEIQPIKMMKWKQSCVAEAENLKFRDRMNLSITVFFYV